MDYLNRENEVLAGGSKTWMCRTTMFLCQKAFLLVWPGPDKRIQFSSRNYEGKKKGFKRKQDNNNLVPFHSLTITNFWFSGEREEKCDKQIPKKKKIKNKKAD
ncbi:hypothetical protein RIF29_41320 [Crotalaria pallida]|uniref:Uncharacterized protein n=1 Tax=Crotalaria pallida TaxID=3830 RepID=A0AAN9HSK3_CROPI